MRCQLQSNLLCTCILIAALALIFLSGCGGDQQPDDAQVAGEPITDETPQTAQKEDVPADESSDLRLIPGYVHNLVLGRDAELLRKEGAAQRRRYAEDFEELRRDPSARKHVRSVTRVGEINVDLLDCRHLLERPRPLPEVLVVRRRDQGQVLEVGSSVSPLLRR